jgi:hypothetical protein
MAKSKVRKMKSANKDGRKATIRAKAAAKVAPDAPRRAVTAVGRRAQLLSDCEMPDPYPGYCVTLVGLGQDHVMTGTHLGTILSSDPPLEVRLEHECTSPGIPNLIITIKPRPS